MELGWYLKHILSYSSVLFHIGQQYQTHWLSLQHNMHVQCSASIHTRSTARSYVTFTLSTQIFYQRNTEIAVNKYTQKTLTTLVKRFTCMNVITPLVGMVYQLIVVQGFDVTTLCLYTTHQYYVYKSVGYSINGYTL